MRLLNVAVDQSTTVPISIRNLPYVFVMSAYHIAATTIMISEFILGSDLAYDSAFVDIDARMGVSMKH